jgi:hypothetical protein
MVVIIIDKKCDQKKFYFFVERKNRIIERVTQFCQPICINSKPDQKSGRSELNRPSDTAFINIVQSYSNLLRL